MSSHQVIARKWRPQKFGDVVGQTHVIRTLRNAIAGNRVGHAYLLVGPRGIGKTTIARIFAKAINCEHPVDGEPCCQCQSCLALASESSLDVIEIDAASRNSVEHMRALSEEAYHMPVSSKFKIYIIDEVHMLSKAAWNALLKTVEEPPAHVKFIFATTEAHLVLPTIVSRCQRFDLRPIAGNLILGRLKMISESENVKIAPEALSAIARAAEGGMRDAQSSLEQMLAFFGGKDQEIAAEQVLELFGLTNAVELDTLIAAMLQNQPGPVVTIVNQLAGRGRNLETLFDDILEMLRGAELMQILADPGAVLDFDDEKLARCRKLSSLTSAEVLRCFMENLAPVGRVLHEALNKAIFLESILLKAMHEAHSPTVGDLLNRLNQLRGAGELEFVNQVPSFQAMPKLAMPVVLPEIPQPSQAIEPPAAKEQVTVTPAPAVEEKIEASPIAVEETVEVAESPTVEAVEETVEVAEAPAVEAVEETVEIEEVPAVETVEVVEEIAEPVPVVEEVQEEIPVATAPLENTAEHQSLWQKLLAEAAGESFSAALQSCEATALTNSVLTVKVPADVMEILRSNRIALMTMLQKITGDWAIMLDLQRLDTAEVNAPAVAEPVANIEEAPAEADVVEEFVEISVEENIEDYSQAMDAPQVSSEPAVPEMELEQFIDLSAEEYENADSQQVLDSEYVYTKRSVIHKAEEIEATSQLQPVQKVLDLFGGEIVDIHA